MGFLDNSGDIILDAVLTDTGRFRLSKGDGSFKVAKFALGDDEINYKTYNKNHASGSAYYDLEILQTPVFEAFTNNTSLMKSKLLSIPRNNLLYLPMLKINSKAAQNSFFQENSTSALPLGKIFLISVDGVTENLTDATTPGIFSTNNNDNLGIMKGFNTNNSNTTIRVDQGLDTTEISSDFDLDSDLIETQYIVEMDSRFGSLAFPQGTGVAPVSFIDDDQVATYYVSQGSLSGGNFITKNSAGSGASNQVIAGPRGTILEFRVKSSLELASSTYLFETLGSSGTTVNGVSVLHIDTTIRVTGATTGYRIDIPVRYVKKTS